MGMGSHRGLSLSILCLLGLLFEPLGWSTGRNVTMKTGGRSCGHWLQQVMAISFAWQIARSLDEWSRDLLIWQGWRASRMCCLDLNVIFKQTCQSGQMFLYFSDIVPKFLLNVFYGTDSNFPLVSHISWPLEINSALSISLDVLYDACMHAWCEKYEMTCYAQKRCLINHALLPKYAQKFWRHGKHISNLIQFFIFQFSLFGRVTLSRSSFIQTNIFS